MLLQPIFELMGPSIRTARQHPLNVKSTLGKRERITSCESGSIRINLFIALGASFSQFHSARLEIRTFAARLRACSHDSRGRPDDGAADPRRKTASELHPNCVETPAG